MNSKMLGLRIATLRKENGLTQTQLAEKLSVSNKAVSRWETGEGFPEITILQKLGEVLGVSIDELLTGEEDEVKAEPVKMPKELTIQKPLRGRLDEVLIVLMPIFIFKLAACVGDILMDRYIELHIMIVGKLNEIYRITTIYDICCGVAFAALLIFLGIRIKKSENSMAKQVAVIWLGAYIISAACTIFLRFMRGQSLNAGKGNEIAMEAIGISYIYAQIAIIAFAGLVCILGTTIVLKKRGVLIAGTISVLLIMQATVALVQYFESQKISEVCIWVIENGTMLFVGIVVICVILPHILQKPQIVIEKEMYNVVREQN